MDEANRPFLTAHDREYLDALFEELTGRHHALAPDLASTCVRSAADALHRKRMCGETANPPSLFWCADLPAHATALAALAAQPRVKRPTSFAVLAVLATVVGALGARIALDLLLRHVAPLRIGGPDLVLITVIAVGVLVTTRIGRAEQMLQGVGIVGVLVVGAVLGAVAGRLLRLLGMDGAFVVLPFWFAVLVVTICGVILWLLSMPRDEVVASR